ncbi:shikimate dehydrogenase [Candidatus Hecatella orcuttiae]|jgi:shikimate dehydrogenase|uniref:shikimate dehydrogenase n=1 Tax=Candidatus Hecatella orcuttiae TaxID=1935119 RepID=UPI0028680957|nr:shikimate dehydrogenase [Candidatus Hecatella orcuttiae]
MKVDSATRVYALIGSPVEHSLSPTIHNAAFESLGLNCVYLAFNVASDGLPSALAGLRSLGVQGFNVTIPHKTAVIPLLDEVEPEARSIGAVNTVKIMGGKTVGYNTDGEGAISALREAGVEVKGLKVVLLGAGGAARALGFTLAKTSGELVVANRTEAKAVKLAEELSRHHSVRVKGIRLNSERLGEELRDAELLVNTTSVGMHPHEDASPIPSRLLHSGLTVFDIVYNPLKTRLLREADAAGAKTVNGLGMLVHQAARSFEIWTGKKAPLDVMFNAALKALGEK